MGVTSSNLCCYCHEHHGLSCIKSEKTSKERNRRTEYCKRHSHLRDQFHESPNILQPHYSAHCDNESMHSYYQEISCFCPSRCRRNKNKPKKSPAGHVYEIKRSEERSSFVFHDPDPLVFPSAYGRTRTPPFPLDVRLSSHSPSNRKYVPDPKEYELPCSPDANRRNTRQPSGQGSGQNSKIPSCVSSAEIWNRGIPPRSNKSEICKYTIEVLIYQLYQRIGLLTQHLSFVVVSAFQTIFYEVASTIFLVAL